MPDNNKDENALIPINSNALVKAGNSIEITKKILAEIDNKKLPFLQIRGKLKWKFKTEDSIEYSVIIMGGAVYFRSGGNHLYSLDCLTGKLKWKFKTEDSIEYSAIVMGGAVYFRSGGYHLYSLDCLTGQLKWKFETKAAFSSYPVVMVSSPKNSTV